MTPLWRKSRGRPESRSRHSLDGDTASSVAVSPEVIRAHPIDGFGISGTPSNLTFRAATDPWASLISIDLAAVGDHHPGRTLLVSLDIHDGAAWLLHTSSSGDEVAHFEMIAGRHRLEIDPVGIGNYGGVLTVRTPASGRCTGALAALALDSSVNSFGGPALIHSCTRTGAGAIDGSEQIMGNARQALCDPAGLGERIRNDAGVPPTTSIVGRPPRLRLDLDEVWCGPRDSVVLEGIRELSALLESQSIAVPETYDDFDTQYFVSYLQSSIVRVCALADILADRLSPGASILDVGAYLGSFALPLARLGYAVTAADQYSVHGESLDGVRAMLEANGVRTRELPFEITPQAVADLGTYDCVISMAVVEHVPHTPRPFIESLRAGVMPGGLLALDTPNLVRFQNRRLVSEGRSIFQDLAPRYWGEAPYRGHHMEFTRDQMEWLLEQAGCGDVTARMLNYNPAQWPEIVAGEHIDALVATVNDPSLADTILAVGSMRGAG